MKISSYYEIEKIVESKLGVEIPATLDVSDVMDMQLGLCWLGQVEKKKQPI